MKKSLQIWSTLIFMLFLFPIMMNFLPSKNATSRLIKDPLRIVYASNVFEEEILEEAEGVDAKKVLLYFTHNQEAYEPVTEARSGKVTATHQTENITKFGEKLQNQLLIHEIDVDILPVDNTAVRNEKGIPFYKSYQSIRPFVQNQIADIEYDLIIDLHRDSLSRDKTTVTYEQQDYAKVAFVIGLEHPNYKKNEKKSLLLKNEMERIVPGITRNTIKKSGRGVDGKYNQDLHANLLLVELGGMENNEGELNRTIAVISEAITNVFEREKLDEN